MLQSKTSMCDTQGVQLNRSLLSITVVLQGSPQLIIKPTS